MRVGDLHVFEDQFRSILRLHAHLDEVATALKALHAALDYEQADALVSHSGVGFRHDDHHVAQDAVGDERLLPVEKVRVALA